MKNPALNLTIRPGVATKTRTKRFVVEMDADRFERLAADLGLFQQEFLESLARAEGEARRGKLMRLRNLKDLRRA